MENINLFIRPCIPVYLYTCILVFLSSYIPVHLFFPVQTLADSSRRSGCGRTQKCTSRAVTDIQPFVSAPETALNNPVNLVKKTLCSPCPLWQN